MTMKVKLSDLSNRMIDHYVRRCHFILKDGCDDKAKWETANKVLPILIREKDRRAAQQTKDIMHNLIHTI